MNIVFRADASINIGSGHVMRCLTLADALKQQGHQCTFICRLLDGHLSDFIRQKGHRVYGLSSSGIKEQTILSSSLPAHYHWLETSWQEDAQQTLAFLGKNHADWLILDHYALDYQWQQACLSGYNKLMVIDDLADRKHVCNLLLDQTYGRKKEHYSPLIPGDCTLFTGAEYALLRPEFSQQRQYSLLRRKKPKITKILINLGGIDKDNVTGMIINALNQISFSHPVTLQVVMGNTAPNAEKVRQQAQSIRHTCHVFQGVNNMAELMSEADLAIGAAGSTSWERCCLGLPAIMVILADNQKMIASQLADAGVTLTLPISEDITAQLKDLLSQLSPDNLYRMSHAARAITRGSGVKYIINHLNKTEYDCR